MTVSSVRSMALTAMPPSVTILSPTSVLSQSPTERPQLAEKRRSHTPLYVEGEYGNRCGGGRRAHSAAMKERAANAGVEGVVVRRKDYASSEDFDAALLKTLKEHNIDLVVLAGFLSVLGPSVIEAYPRRILNIHPALIPSFCGPGMYGLRPHEAALARGCKVTGATVHFVNEECDGGPILLQKAVDILPGDTPEVLQKRVMEQAEWKLLPKAVAMVCSGEIK
mgnify:CR=1 FL=1